MRAILDLTDGEGVDSNIEALARRLRLRPRSRSLGQEARFEYIRTALCPRGKERMRRLLRLIANGRVDPTLLTTHRFAFGQIETAFRVM